MEDIDTYTVVLSSADLLCAIYVHLEGSWHQVGRNVCKRWREILCAHKIDIREVALGRDIVYWAAQCGYDISADSGVVVERAAARGDMEQLFWARSRGAELDYNAPAGAARGGYLGVLQWLRRYGCRWDSRTTIAAARGGHTHVLQWAIDNGCPRAGSA